MRGIRGLLVVTAAVLMCFSPSLTLWGRVELHENPCVDVSRQAPRGNKDCASVTFRDGQQDTLRPE
jgi:hypothetical protein